jgi:multidrug efflux pump
MTSAATICGHFPLTLVSGAGAAARNSIGITIVAGMSLGTIFTLLVIPSIYVLIARQHAGEEPGAIARDFEQAAHDHAGGPLALAAAPK